MLAFRYKSAALAATVGLVLAVLSPSWALAGPGSPTGASIPGICSSGGCLPRAPCQDSSTLCSPFPDHPGFDPNVEFRRGAAALKAADYKVAQAAFGKVLYMAPTNSDVLYALGVADVGLGDLAAAAQAFERAIRWNPKQIPAARELAITALKLGQPDKANVQLVALKIRAGKCGGACPEASDLRAAIDAIETALPGAGAS
jgi:tetratricopeptide (TPR) repeat protein